MNGVKMKGVKKLRNEILYAFVLLIIILLGLIYSYLFYKIKVAYVILLSLFVIDVVYIIAAIHKFVFVRNCYNLSKKLGFNFFLDDKGQPRMDGNYESNQFQLHFRYKLGGKFDGRERTYVKLRFLKEEKIDESKLDNYCSLSGFDILNISYVKKPGKYYLLMKVVGYIFVKDDIMRLLNHIIKVYGKVK